MPEPINRAERYMPGLDGLRALAVIAVVAYHLNLGFAPGGMLGVGVFFTLSGYLITDLLLTGRGELRTFLENFWIRRARRLLPALFVMLILVTVWVAIGHRSQLGTVRGQDFAAAVYISNWWQIFQHTSYFARFGPLSPLNHLWSLAVEEQFYLLWPWLLLFGLRHVREPKLATGVRPRLAALTVLLAIASAVEMSVLYHPSFDPTRIYDGTDTRAFGLLFGAALAMIWPRRLLTRKINPNARRTLDRAGYLGLGVIALLIWRTNQYSAFPYRGGLVLLSLATVLVIAAGAHPATRLGRMLGWAPLRWLGVRSYGIYLWHVPIIILTTPAYSQAFDAPRATLQVAASVSLAALSWRYVESPIRSGKLGAALTHWRLIGWHRISRRTRYGAIGAVAVAAAVMITAALVRSQPSTPLSLAAAHAASSRPARARTRPRTELISRVVTGDPRLSSCTRVVHFGDSTSDGLISSDYLPRRRDRSPAQYARVGAKATFEIQGGTSIVETIDGEQNAYTIAKRLVRSGYHGCWVIALGTNDSADVAVGSNVGLSTRIARMMSVIGNDPVMWVNVKSLLGASPYTETGMSSWNTDLVRACQRHPNMRVFDWASAVKDNWFTVDGIHYTSLGYRHRAKDLAQALARAFPRRGSSTGCVVTLPSPRSIGA